MGLSKCLSRYVNFIRISFQWDFLSIYFFLYTALPIFSSRNVKSNDFSKYFFSFSINTIFSQRMCNTLFNTLYILRYNPHASCTRDIAYQEGTQSGENKLIITLHMSAEARNLSILFESIL